MKKIYITKYFFTDGLIIEKEAEIEENDIARVEEECYDGLVTKTEYYLKEDYFYSLDEAIDYLKQKVKRKIESLQVEIEKLKGLEEKLNNRFINL